MSSKVKKYIWYQVDEGEISRVEQSSVVEFGQLRKAIKEREGLQAAASTLILKAKKTTEQEYTTLNANFFRNDCGNSFDGLIRKFTITQHNPIKVTLPENQEMQRLREEVAALRLTQGTSSPARAPAQALNEIHVRYGDKTATFRQAWLDDEGVSNMEKLKRAIKFRLDISENIILRRGENEVLGSETPITGLYNTEDQALHVVVEDIFTINIIVKAPGNREFYFDHRRIGSLSEIIEFIKSRESLTQFITEQTIFQADDKEVLSLQHLELARQSGSLNVTLFNPSTIDTGSEMHKESLRRAFDVEYLDKNGMINKFGTYLNSKHKTWKDDIHHYVPYTTIFQSSGYGKSRLVKEMAKRIPTIYLCLRDANSTGYPPRTTIGAELFERMLKELKEGEEWRFTYILQVAIQYFNEELVNLNGNLETLWNNQMDPDYCATAWTAISRRSDNWKSIIDTELNMSADFITNDNSNNNVCFLLCIDEARTLISPTDRYKFSPFRLFRRALKSVRWHGFFTLFLDTLSRISNFAPPKSIDPSHRDVEDMSLELFYPYFRLTTIDSFNTDDGENENDERKNLAKYGRPLYMSYLQSNIGDHQAINKLMNLLKRKLLGGANSFENSQKDITCLAILSSVVGLDMSPQSQLASELVASHMATCLAVSEDRERLIIVYPSEPLLSEAAFELMSAPTLLQILSQFNILLKKGIVEPGPRGEIIARIILILVAHRLRAQKAENSVNAFLNELYKEESMPDLDNAKTEFIEGTVAFTHFNAIDYIPTKRSLAEFYTRRCAFIMKRNHPGADICIPVKLTTGEYSMIIIQIKNINSPYTKADRNYPASARSKSDCDHVFDKSDLKEHDKQCLCLYWQLRFQGHYQEIPKLQDTRSSESRMLNICWASFGFDHFKMNKDVASILKDILVSHISPFESEWQVNNTDKGDIWDWKEIKIMHPLGYYEYDYEKEKKEKEKEKGKGKEKE